MDRLLLKDVVAVARLDRNSARYVLDQSNLKIQRASVQGQHRRFSVDEAVRLALCTRMVMVGLSLDAASAATGWCEAWWRKMTKNEHPEHLFEGSVTNPWNIFIIRDGPESFVQVMQDRPQRDLATHNDLDAYYRVSDGAKVNIDELATDKIEISWNVTFITLMLMKQR